MSGAVGARQLFLAATGQNRGKTTTSLGLFSAFRAQGLDAGFMKPVGQRWITIDDTPADEDAALMRGVFDLTDAVALLSPVQIPRGFTRKVIEGEVVEDLGAKIVAAQVELAKNHELLLLEGTGHAGVGAVIGLSNADVAALLEAPVIIVSEGGIGRPIDEIVLNAALFAARGVEVAGAIVNKVDLDLQPELPRLLEKGLARHGIPLLGVLPYRQILSNPTLAIIEDGLQGETLWPGRDMDAIIARVSVAAMQPEHVMQRIGESALVVVPGDREDVLEALTQLWLDGAEHPNRPLGFVLSGGYRPSAKVLEMIRAANIFAVLMEGDTYSVASKVHDLLVKTHPEDVRKIEEIKQLVASSLDVRRILAAARPVPSR
ncbi:MAG: phosphotransacetylase family protein [Candidatus Limnocylindrus sp.]